MSFIAVGAIGFAFIVGGWVCGVLLRRILPADHLRGDSKDTVKAGLGLVGTMTAMILGLLVASAKGTYDTQTTELTRLSANVVFLDRLLANYGPETESARDVLRGAVVHLVDGLASRDPSGASELDPFATDSELLYDKIQNLLANTDERRFLKGQALNHAISIGQARWLIYEQASTSAVPKPLLVTLICWLTMIFVGFGLFTSVNPTTVVCMFVSAASVSIAILMILEMYSPYGGLIHVSAASLQTALTNLGR